MKKENTNLFLKEFKLNKDTNMDGWWNTYDKMEKWLNENTEISILARSMNEHIPKLYKKMFKEQKSFDYQWKKHIATNLLEDLKIEWEKEDISIEFIINELVVTAITFCFYTEGDFCIYFRPKTINCEHGIILLGDKKGNLLRTHIE